MQRVSASVTLESRERRHATSYTSSGTPAPFALSAQHFVSTLKDGAAAFTDSTLSRRGVNPCNFWVFFFFPPSLQPPALSTGTTAIITSQFVMQTSSSPGVGRMSPRQRHETTLSSITATWAWGSGGVQRKHCPWRTKSPLTLISVFA